MGMKDVRFVKTQVRRGGFVRGIGIFTLGAATGGIVALLFAPASGRVTRKRIGLKLRAMQRNTARQIGQAKRLLVRQAENLREAAAERLIHARQWVGHAVNGNGSNKRPHQQRTVHHA